MVFIYYLSSMGLIGFLAMASTDYSSPWCIYWALDVMDFMLCLVASAFAWIIVDFVQDVRDFVGRR
ncbi:hypothetical protein LOS88_11625 [Aeromonas veronii]|uniref:hypothetical protein n=1 Tax=Aeromonas veronii TaxID=654 RepID=UPI001FD13012|nr:hypothetical protein [Aeromonas veronii]MCJ7978370.1 hypothetical protein [Aeromonas veronii]UOR21225.1 hypothetical protein LOS88_11625 [Aeromonas veronii]